MMTSNTIVTVPPPATSAPTSTVTVASPTVLPELTTPAVVVIDPLTRDVLGSGVSLKTTPDASSVPPFVIVTV